MAYIVDGSIDLVEVAEGQKWHLGSVIAALQDRGLTRFDAEAYADLIFKEHSTIVDDEPDLTAEQWARLSE